MEMKFYKCDACGRIMAAVKDTPGPVVCCGGAMREIVPGTVEASREKHIPVCSVDGDTVTVQVGSVLHPMGEEHFIEWIAIQTSSGNQRKPLRPGDEPKACFKICEGDAVEAAYAYCNLHGLWKA